MFNHGGVPKGNRPHLAARVPGRDRGCL